MANKPGAIITYNRKIVQKIFNQKRKFHLRQARLPVEEKIKILVELQKISLAIHPKKSRRDKRVVWQIT